MTNWFGLNAEGAGKAGRTGHRVTRLGQLPDPALQRPGGALLQQHAVPGGGGAGGAGGVPLGRRGRRPGSRDRRRDTEGLAPR